MPDTISDVFEFFCRHGGLLGPLLRGERATFPLTDAQNKALDAAAPHIEQTMVDVLLRCWAGFRSYDYRHPRHNGQAHDHASRREVRQTRSVWGPVIQEGPLVLAQAGYSFSEIDEQLHLTAWVWLHPTRLEALEAALPSYARPKGSYLWRDAGVLTNGRSIADIVNHLVPDLVSLTRTVEEVWPKAVAAPHP